MDVSLLLCQGNLWSSIHPHHEGLADANGAIEQRPPEKMKLPLSDFK
jgi:hypothetical protein